MCLLSLCAFTRMWISKQVTPGTCEVYPNCIIDKVSLWGKKSLWHLNSTERMGIKEYTYKKKGG